MNATDIRHAVVDSDTNPVAVCAAIDLLLPVLRSLRDAASGWKFWIKLGLSVAIAALEDYYREECRGRDAAV